MAEHLTDGSDQSNLLSLKWNNHLSNFKVIIASLQEKSVLSDATLACDGQLFPVHKLVLSTCSEFFGRVFSSTPCKHPVIVLQDLQPQHLHYLLSYMYVGEVNVPQAHLPTLIRAAETLQIKGLAAPDEEPLPIQGSMQPRLTKKQNQKDYYIPSQNTGQDILDKLAVSKKSSAKRRRCFSVEHQEEITECVNYSKDGGKENNSGDNYEKRLNPLDVKRSRKVDSDICDTGQQYTNRKNKEMLPFVTDVKEETLSKSSPIEQVGSIKEECDISGSDDVTSLEEGLGGWGDEQGTVDWACSSGQHEGSASALPWIPFSSPSSLSAQDCEEASSIALTYTSQFEPCIEDLPQRALASVQEGYTSLQLPRTDFDARGSDQRSGRPAGGGSPCANSNNCITSDPQLLSQVKRLPTAGEARREVLSSITSSNCSGSIGAEFSAQGVGRSRSIISSYNGFGKNSRSDSTKRQSHVSTGGSNSDTDLNNLLNIDTHFIGSEPNTLSSEIFSNIIGITGGGTASKSGSGGGVVSTSCGPLHDCPMCPKTFQSRADVVRHLRTHTGERPYKCPHCHYRAALKGNLKSHILSRHIPDKGAVGALLNAASLPK